ncbi:sugar transferase [bacterium]|nr:sugar transferase [bacterium]
MNSLLKEDIRHPTSTKLPRRFSGTLYRRLRAAILILLDMGLLAASVAIAHAVRSTLLVAWFGPPSLDLAQRLRLFPIFWVIQALLFSQVGLYGAGDRRRNLRAILKGVSLAALTLYVGSRIYPPHAHPSFLVLLWAFSFVLVALGRIGIDHLLNALRMGGFALSHSLVIGKDAQAVTLFQRLKRPSYHLLGQIYPGHLPAPMHNGYMGGLNHLEALLERHHVHEVLLVEDIPIKEREAVLETCMKFGVPMRVALSGFTTTANPIALQTHNGHGVLEVVQPRLRISQFALKRFFDVTATTLGLILLSPFLLLVALAIKLDSPGPILFKQQRVTVKGRTFWMYKFRSMRVNAEAELEKIIHLNERKDTLMFKLDRDPRVTRLGRLLRRTSLDELPQLINVLRGEMSLVGPRPPLPREVEQYSPHHRQRLEVLPGLTGMWQVSGRSDITDFEEVVRLDLSYIREWSLWLDFKILFKTIPAVLQSKGAR